MAPATASICGWLVVCEPTLGWRERDLSESCLVHQLVESDVWVSTKSVLSKRQSQGQVLAEVWPSERLVRGCRVVFFLVLGCAFLRRLCRPPERRMSASRWVRVFCPIYFSAWWTWHLQQPPARGGVCPWELLAGLGSWDC